MPRPLSDGFVLGLERADEESDGVKLARACIKANLAVKFVAEGLGVSRMTLHTWLRGGKIRQSNKEKVKKFIIIIEEALEDRRLPAKSLAIGKAFVDSEVRPVL